MIRILCRRYVLPTCALLASFDHLITINFRTKNSPILLGEPFKLTRYRLELNLIPIRFSGEPGVGKTAIAEGLAQRIVAKDVPESLNAKLFSLDMGALIAGTGSRGEYEEVI